MCVDDDLRQQGDNRAVMIQHIFQRLFDHVANHPVGLGPQQIKGPSVCLQRQKADLRTVAVGYNQLVPGADNRGQGARGAFDIVALRIRCHRFAPAQHRVSAQGRNDQHSSHPKWPPARP